MLIKAWVNYYITRTLDAEQRHFQNFCHNHNEIRNAITTQVENVYNTLNYVMMQRMFQTWKFLLPHSQGWKKKKMHGA